MARVKNFGDLLASQSSSFVDEKEAEADAAGEVQTPAETAAPVEEEAHPVAEPANEEKPKPAPRTKTSRAKKPAPAPKPAVSEDDDEDDDEASGTDEKTVGVPVHLPKRINDRLIAFMADTNRSHPMVLLDAIEVTYEHLGELIQKKLGIETQPKTKLFNRSGVRSAVIAEKNTEKHTVQVSKGDRDMLGQIANDLGAPSRTFMIVVAYDAYLPQLPDEN